MNPNSTTRKLKFITSITAYMTTKSARNILKSNQTRSFGPKAMWSDDKTFWSIIFLITTESNTFLSRKKKKQWTGVITTLKHTINFMHVYGIIWGGKKLTKFYFLYFFPTKNTYIYSYRAHLSKIFFTRRFHNKSNSHDTVTSCLLAMQNIYKKKRVMNMCNKRRYPQVYLLINK